MNKIFVFSLLLSFVLGTVSCSNDEKLNLETNKTSVNFTKTPWLVNYDTTKFKIFPKEIIPNVKNLDFVIQSENMLCVSNKGKIGYINIAGEDITDFEFDYGTPFNEGLACVKKDGKYGFINNLGEVVLPFKYDNASAFNDGLAYFQISDKYGFINNKGEQVVALDCESVSSFNEGLAFFSNGGKYGYINAKGETVIEAQYDDAGYFDNGVAIVRKGPYIGCINTKGDVVVPFEYIFIEKKDKTIIAHIKFFKDQVYYDYNGNVIKEEFENETRANTNTNQEEYEFVDGLAIVYKESKYGIIDENNREVVAFGAYDFIYSLSDKVVAFKQGEVYKVGNRKGLLVSDNSYYRLIPLYNKSGNIIYENNNGYGILDENGKEILHKNYSYIRSVIGSDYTYLASDYNSDISNTIILTGMDTNSEKMDDDLKRFVLKNHITPKIGVYNDFANKNVVHTYNNEDSNVEWLSRVKLFKVDDYQQPILYFYEEPAISGGFPESNSAFYSVENNALQVINWESECGGSARGTYAQLYYDNTCGKTLLGSAGAFGGFGGFAVVHNVMTEENISIDFSDVSQSIKSYDYSDDFLLENYYLFYEDESTTYTKGNILQNKENSAYVYYINDKLVTREDYNIKLNEYNKINMNFN